MEGGKNVDDPFPCKHSSEFLQDEKWQKGLELPSQNISLSLSIYLYI